MESHNFQWVNPLFLWPFSIANCKRLPEGRQFTIPDGSLEPGVPTMAPVALSKIGPWRSFLHQEVIGPFRIRIF